MGVRVFVFFFFFVGGGGGREEGVDVPFNGGLQLILWGFYVSGCSNISKQKLDLS